MATSTIKPVHAGIDFAFTIGASDWSSSSPFTYTWTNSAVTDGCRVEVEFSSSSQNTEVASISYEKTSGGVTFSTKPIKPTTNISVIVHVINAQTGNVIAPTDTSIITSAVTGAANVHEALSTYTTTATLPSGVTAQTNIVAKRLNIVYINLLVSKSQWAEGALIATLPVGYRPSYVAHTFAMNYNMHSDNVQVSIGTDGTIKIWNKGTQAAGNIYVDTVFMTDINL